MLRPSPFVVAAGYAAGAIPFSNLVSRWCTGVDLRTVDRGTVSGTALYRVAGFGPLAVAGVLDVAKGSIGPALAGRDRPGVAAVSGAAAVAGHNWSPLLRGAGGRGIAPALGALGVHHWPGTAVLLAGLTGGRLARHTGLGSFVAMVALVPVLAGTRGRGGAAMGASIAAVMVAKRLLANEPPRRRRLGVLVHRVLFDRDPDPAPSSTRRPDRERTGRD